MMTHVRAGTGPMKRFQAITASEKTNSRGRTAETCGVRPVVLKRRTEHRGDDQPVDRDADTFGRDRNLGDDDGEKEDEQRDGDGQRSRSGRTLRPGQEPAHIGGVRQCEEGHLGNEQSLGTHGVAGGREQEGEPEREQFPAPQQERRHAQQQDRIGDFKRERGGFGKEQHGSRNEERGRPRKYSGKSSHRCIYREPPGSRWGRAVFRLPKVRQARTCAPHFCSNCRVRFDITRSMVRSSSVRVLSSRMKLKA